MRLPRLTLSLLLAVLAALSVDLPVGRAQSSQPAAAPLATNPASRGREISARVRSVDPANHVMVIGSTANEAMAALLGIPHNRYIRQTTLTLGPEVKLVLCDQRAKGDISNTVTLADVQPGYNVDVHYAADEMTAVEIRVRGADGWGLVKEVDPEKNEVALRNNRGIEVITLLPDARIWRTPRDASAEPLAITVRDIKPMTAIHYTSSTMDKGKITALGETALDLKEAMVKSVDAEKRQITLEFKLISETLTQSFAVAPNALIGSFDVKTPALPLGQLTGHRVEAQLHVGDPTTIDEINIDIPLPESFLHPATAPSRLSTAPATRPRPLPHLVMPPADAPGQQTPAP